ncbi:unnamed protein product [Ambrosiozyma monospora]|uniref:Unnamed protein product n=1 Tax=Ambrosiozyma monospora TaxID=43982 RepID=A0ACB5UBT0_AMBMO|nr:unnamed protein product [Ambrosiozyma monospora]
MDIDKPNEDSNDKNNDDRAGNEAEDEESSDDEEEIEAPPKQELIIDLEKLKSIKERIVSSASELSISDLEQLNSKIIEIVYLYRLDVDKTQLLNDLEDVLK